MGDVSRTNTTTTTTTTTIVKSGSNRNDNTRSLITRSSTRCSPTAAARDISEARIISLTRSYGLDVDEVERAHLASLPNDRARKVRCRMLLMGERSDRCGLARASTFVAPGLAMDEEEEERREDKGKENACGGYVGYGYVGGSAAAAAAARADAGVGRNNLVSPDYFEDLDLGPSNTSGGDPYDPFGLLPKSPTPRRRPWTWPSLRSIKRSITTSSSFSSSSTSTTTTLPLYTVRSLPVDPPSPFTTSIPPARRGVDNRGGSSSLAHGLSDPRTPYATTPASSSASTLSSYRTATTTTVVPPPPPSEASASVSFLSEDLARVLTPASTTTTTTMPRNGEACERQGGEGEGSDEEEEERMRRMNMRRRRNRRIALALAVLLVVLVVIGFGLWVEEMVRWAGGGDKEGEEV
ncbi:hypothetical protein DBV05_g8314 [Lasiodiplodia theobromae]|uniref:Uncharacterized protein n=1 Tax=Lasiodiplodia theobromae TaxID=45133 RepID=A0A5N5D5I0_9PEZI|nr:hypothetical protein DBV05_g8314 [Lasiodiplodia theobromae]